MLLELLVCKVLSFLDSKGTDDELHSSTHATPWRTLCTCKTQSSARLHCESAAGTSTPGRCGTFRSDIGLFTVSFHPLDPSRLSQALSPAFPRHSPPPPNKTQQRTFRLVNIVPRALPAQNVLDFLLLQVLALVVALVDDELVGAGQAFEAVLADVLLDCGIAGGYATDAQHVAACWADWVGVSGMYGVDGGCVGMNEHRLHKSDVEGRDGDGGEDRGSYRATWRQCGGVGSCQRHVRVTATAVRKLQWTLG